jgi:DNA-directed RNA polymerase II subunit RPB1
MSVGNNLLSAAINAPTMGVVQDALLACWLLSGGRGPVFVERALFYDTMLVASESRVPIPALLKPEPRWTGTQLIDLAWPIDFHYHRKGVLISDGQLLSGVLTKKTLGRVSEGIVHAIHHSHGAEATLAFLNKIQNVANFWMLHSGFSVGVQDCCPEYDERCNIYETVNTQIALNTIYPRSAAEESVLYNNLNKARDVAAGGYLTALDTDKSNALVAMVSDHRLKVDRAVRDIFISPGERQDWRP